MSFQQSDYNGIDSVLLPSSIIGFKHWSFQNNVPKSSHYADWSNGKWEAVCGKHKEHKSPDVDCTCGIYAHYLPMESYSIGPAAVLGVVEASGKIVMGTKGFRAEKMKILALAGIGTTNKWFEFIETFDACIPVLEKYCEPLGIDMFTDVREMKAKYPQTDLSALGIMLGDVSMGIQMEKDHQESVRRVAVSNMMNNIKEYTAQQVATLGLDKQGTERMMETLKHLGGF